MTNNTPAIVLTDAAAALVKSDVTAFNKDRKRYSDYVAEMNVTADTVAAHVAIFRDAFKGASKKNADDKAAIKAYATKVRNGLNYWVGKADTDEDDKPVNYLTTDGLAALADLDPEALAVAIAAEVERRQK